MPTYHYTATCPVALDRETLDEVVQELEARAYCDIHVWPDAHAPATDADSLTHFTLYYVALDRGEPVHGSIRAASSFEALEELRDRGYEDICLTTSPPTTITPAAPLARIELARATAEALANSVALTARTLGFFRGPKIPRDEVAFTTIIRIRGELATLDEVIELALPGGVFKRPVAETGTMGAITDRVLDLCAKAAEVQLEKIEILIGELYEQI